MTQTRRWKITTRQGAPSLHFQKVLLLSWRLCLVANWITIPGRRRLRQKVHPIRAGSNVPSWTPVVSANVPTAARTADRASSRIQNFWLDAANPLIFLLEKADELNMSVEVISGIQTSLQLMGNANYQHSMDRRHALMMQLNPKLKQLFSYKDFRDAVPFLFGENFGTLAKDRLEAAEALRKSMPMANPKKGFQKGHFQKNSRGGGSQYSGTGGSRGWQGPATKPRKGTHQRND